MFDWLIDFSVLGVKLKGPVLPRHYIPSLLLLYLKSNECGAGEMAGELRQLGFCSHKEPEFSSQHSCQAAHITLYLQLQGIKYPFLSSVSNCTHMNTLTHKHKYTYIIKNKTNIRDNKEAKAMITVLLKTLKMS